MKKELKLGITALLLITSYLLFFIALSSNDLFNTLWLIAMGCSIVGGWFLVDLDTAIHSERVKTVILIILLVPWYFTIKAAMSASIDTSFLFYVLALFNFVSVKRFMLDHRSDHYNRMVQIKLLNLLNTKFLITFNSPFNTPLNQTVEKVLVTDISNFPKKKYSNEAFFNESEPLVQASERYLTIVKKLNVIKNLSNNVATTSNRDAVKMIQNWPVDLKSVNAMTFYKTFHGIHIGLGGEENLFKVLDQLGIRSLNNAVCQAPTGETIEVDAIFVYNGTVYSVEAKNYEAPKIVLSSGGSFTRFDKHGIEHAMDTLSQVTRHKRILKTILGNEVPIVNVIVLTNSDTIVEDHFKNKELIVATLDSLPFIFSDSQTETDFSKLIYSKLQQVQTEGKQYEFPDVSLLKNEWNQSVTALKSSIQQAVSIQSNLHQTLQELKENEIKKIFKEAYFTPYDANALQKYPMLNSLIEEILSEGEKTKQLYIELQDVLVTV